MTGDDPLKEPQRSHLGFDFEVCCYFHALGYSMSACVSIPYTRFLHPGPEKSAGYVGLGLSGLNETKEMPTAWGT